MASPSKEENVLKLILENSPLKEWRFKEIVKEAKVTKRVAHKWLKKYSQEGLLKKTKEKDKFPSFTVGVRNPIYYSLKRIYALKLLHECGLISTLLSLEKAKTIILFGSIIRGDWYRESDIDLFIYGEADDFDKKKYEFKLNKNIELHLFENKKELQEVRTGLIKNIINGYIIKGQIQDIAEVA